MRLSPSIVQHKARVGGNANSLTLTFDSALTPGNVAIVAVCWSRSFTLTTPTGWTLLDTQSASAGIKMATYYREIQSGDPATFTINASGSDFINAVGYEIRNQKVGAPINGHAISTTDGGGTTFDTPNVTPTSLGCLALGFFGTNEANVLSGPYTDTVSTGWTLDEAAHDDYHAQEGASKNALTTDLVTAITVRFTAPQNLFKSCMSTVLIEPGIASDTQQQTAVGIG